MAQFLLILSCFILYTVYWFKRLLFLGAFFHRVYFGAKRALFSQNTVNPAIMARFLIQSVCFILYTVYWLAPPIPRGRFYFTPVMCTQKNKADYPLTLLLAL